MRIYLLPENFTGSEQYTIRGKDAHYLTRVLRLAEGDSFPGRDRSGRSWNLTLTQIDKGSCTLSCSMSAGNDLVQTDAHFPIFMDPSRKSMCTKQSVRGRKWTRSSGRSPNWESPV